MSQLIQHYQTSFVVQNDTQSWDNKLFQAQYLVGEWIKQRESKRFHQMGRDKTVSFILDGAFKRRSVYKSKYSWCRTDYCKEECSFAWAVRYTHRDSKARNVFWVSDIGLRAFAETGRLIVNVKISYKISSEYALTGGSFNPNTSIPRCVVGLLETFKGSRFLSGEEDITNGIGCASLISTEEEAEGILAYINSPERKLAVVLLHGETEEVRKEANFLSKNLFAKALVCVVPYKMEIKKVFRRLKMEFNECVFITSYPIYEEELKHKLRYFVTDRKKSKERQQIIFHAWLGVHPINEKGGVSDIENVALLIRRRQYFNLVNELKASISSEQYEKVKNELKDISGLNELFETENVELKNRVDELEERNLDLEIKNEDMEKEYATKVHNLRAAHESKCRKATSSSILLPREYPDSFQALRQYEAFYEHLVFANNAWEPAMEYRQFKDFNVAWEMLHDLDQKLWNIIFVKRGDIEREFEVSTVYEYARGEGKQTMNDTKLSRMRKFEFEGQEYEMWTHLKYGNRPGKQLRIHFAIDHNKQRIIVGYIGEHMDNATTRSIH